MTSRPVDLFLVYQFLKRLTTPFDQTPAFKLGLIDADGKRIKKAHTEDEHAAMGYFDRLVFNLKRLLAKLPAGQTRLATFAAALVLLKEDWSENEVDDESLLGVMLDEKIEEARDSELWLMEDAPTNATGVGVSGTGGDPVHWRKRQPKIGRKGDRRKYGQPLDWASVIRRRAKT